RVCAKPLTEPNSQICYQIATNRNRPFFGCGNGTGVLLMEHREDRALMEIPPTILDPAKIMDRVILEGGKFDITCDCSAIAGEHLDLGEAEVAQLPDLRLRLNVMVETDVFLQTQQKP